ncbi:unnamed protein product, partial [marine sediment metagenome]
RIRPCIEAAKALSLAWNKPLIPVNHLIGHIYANFLEGQDIPFPALVLIVSGGHTDLVLMKNHGDFEYIGGTLDDAAGEAFDKTARLLGISKYLGGALLSKEAATCIDNTIRGELPRPMINEDSFDFSFSGLKTAVKRLVEKEEYPTNVVACEFETAVVDVLVKKTINASKKFRAKSILLGGGVAANTQLRFRLKLEAEKVSIPVFVPPIRPGPTVTARTSILSIPLCTGAKFCACRERRSAFPTSRRIVSSTTGITNSTCFLAATSGTTPPVFS